MEKINISNPFIVRVISKAKHLPKVIVLPEAQFSTRVLQAGLYVAEHKIARVVLLANDNSLDKYASEWVHVVNMAKHEIAPMLASALHIKRAEKGVTLEDATKLIRDPMYFGTMMVELGLADGMCAGAETATSKVLRPALQIIKARNPNDIVSSVTFMTKGSKVYALADCAVNPNPTTSQLALIAKQTVVSFGQFVSGTPHVALLSYSTKGSAQGDSPQLVRQAVEQLQAEQVDFDYDGELQLDSAVDIKVRKLKAPSSKLQTNANVLIFPDLDSGNIGYKIMQRFGGYKAIGPIVQGLRAPVNDISRGASVEEIITIISITAIQAN